MPYIPQDQRGDILTGVKIPVDVGQLNYRITARLDAFVTAYGLRYDVLNSAIGVLAAIQLRSFPQFNNDESELFDDIREIIRDYMRGQVTITGGVIGVLECAKLELYARVVRPYEKTKAMLNGDVYSANILP